jgi:hypothetical protein
MLFSLLPNTTLTAYTSFRQHPISPSVVLDRTKVFYFRSCPKQNYCYLACTHARLRWVSHPTCAFLPGQYADETGQGAVQQRSALSVTPPARTRRPQRGMREALAASTPLLPVLALTRHRSPPTPNRHCPAQRRASLSCPTTPWGDQYSSCAMRVWSVECPNGSVTPSATDAISAVCSAGHAAGQDARRTGKALRVRVNG